MHRNAEDLLTELGVTSPEDIDIETIAQYCGAIVRYERLDGCEARLLGNGSRAIITVNKNGTVARKRFGIGHELGHWAWDRGKVLELCQKKDLSIVRAQSHQEQRANGFAADLLMPSYLFKPRAIDKDVVLDTVDLLAADFKTSLTATALRLVALGKPSAIVASDENRRTWYRLGPDVPKALRPHESLEERCGPVRLHRSNRNRTDPIALAADVWIDHANACSYELIEQSVRLFESSYLTLLWWESEEQIIALDEE